MDCLGNKELLNVSKTAFICSRRVCSFAVLPCYDWATAMLASDDVIVSGFQSKIEKDVLQFFLLGKHPIILVLARRMYKTLSDELKTALEDGRLLIISAAPNASRVSKSTADIRNNFIADLADKVVFGYIHPNSELVHLYNKYSSKSQVLVQSQPQIAEFGILPVDEKE